MVGTWLQEFFSCSCLTVLLGSICILLSKFDNSLFSPLWPKSGVFFCVLQFVFSCGLVSSNIVVRREGGISRVDEARARDVNR